MKNLIKLFLLLVLSSSVIGEELKFTLYHPPGGSADMLVNSLVPSLERNGVTVKKEFYQSCASAFESISESPANNVVATFPGDIIFENANIGGKCPPISTLKVKLIPLQGSIRAPMLLCTAPEYKGTSISRLTDLSKSSGKIRIGYFKNDIVEGILRKFVTQYPNISFALLPYSGGGTLRTAVMAKDVDLFLSMTLANEFKERGSVCFGSTAKQTGLLFLGENSKTVFPEYYLTTALATSAGKLSKELQEKIHLAFKSPEFKTLEKSMPATYSDMPSEKMIAEFALFNVIFGPLAK